MLRLGCLGDLLRFEKREIEVAAFAPDRSSPQSNRGDEAERTGSVGEGAGAALRMEAPVVAGVVGVKPESSLGFRLKFDEAGFVVSAVHSLHVMLLDIEALESGAHWLGRGRRRRCAADGSARS